MQLTYTLEHDGLALGRKKYSNSRPVKVSTNFNGLPLSLEILPGETKSGIDANGEKWTKTYSVPYGEIPNSLSLADGDGVDIYLAGSNPNAKVYVVHQLKHTGEYDEDKVVLGAANADEAKKIYSDHGPAWGFGSLDEMSWQEFKNGYLASNRKL